MEQGATGARLRRRTVGVLGAILATIVISAGGYGSTVVVASDDVVRTPTGCPLVPPMDTVAEPDRVAAVVPKDQAPTATDHARADFDLPGALRDVRHLGAGFEPVAEAVLPSTGMHVTVLSDGPLEVDVEELDRLTRIPLTQPELFRNARVTEVQRCYADRILRGRELAGRPLRILVPSDPSTCFRGGRLVSLRGGLDVRACDSAGVTFPEVDLRPGLLGLELAEVSVPATVILTAATAPGRPDPEGVLAGLLLHEFHHVVENAFGLTPWSGSLRHYEQRAYYVEREVRRHLRSRGLALPRPIRFVGDAAGAA